MNVRPQSNSWAAAKFDGLKLRQAWLIAEAHIDGNADIWNDTISTSDGASSPTFLGPWLARPLPRSSGGQGLQAFQNSRDAGPVISHPEKLPAGPMPCWLMQVANALSLKGFSAVKPINKKISADGLLLIQFAGRGFAPITPRGSAAEP